jgi:hypothetical protein
LNGGGSAVLLEPRARKIMMNHRARFSFLTALPF